MPICASAINSQSAWLICSTSIRCTAPTGCRTGQKGTTCYAPHVVSRSPCLRLIAGRPNCGERCCWTSVLKAWRRVVRVFISALFSVSTNCRKPLPACRHGLSSSVFLRCRPRRLRRSRGYLVSVRCCCVYSTLADTTGLISSRTRTFCVTSTSVSSVRVAPRQ